MKKYPLKAAFFLAVLSLLAFGYALFIIFNTQFTRIQIIPLLILMILGIWSESYTIYLEEGNIHLSPIDSVYFAAYLTSGFVATLIIILATNLLRFRKTGLLRGNLRTTPFRLTLFNIAHYVLILGIVHYSYSEIVNATGLLLVPALLISPLFFLLSCLLNAFFYKLEEGRLLLHYLKEIFLPHFLNGISASFAVVIIALAYPYFGFISLFFFFIPIIVTRLLYLESKEN